MKYVINFFKACFTVIVGFLVIAIIVTIACAICKAFGWHVPFLQAIARWFYAIFAMLLKWVHGLI